MNGASIVEDSTGSVPAVKHSLVELIDLVEQVRSGREPDVWVRAASLAAARGECLGDVLEVAVSRYVASA